MNGTQSLTDEALDAVSLERNRQEKLKRAGKFNWSCADSSTTISDFSSVAAIGHAGRLAVLAEEFGEVARHVAETLISSSRYDQRELKKELIQVAAVAVAWIEAIDAELELLEPETQKEERAALSRGIAAAASESTK